MSPATMSGPRIAIEVDRVAALMREAAEAEVLPRFGRLAPEEIAQKHPGDVVTVADRRAERYLRDALVGLLPGSTVVGEEMADADPSVLDRLGGSDPVWIVDPLDGTRNFAAGKPCFAMIVALSVGGDTVAGVILDPLSGRTVQAEAGAGAWEGGRRLSRRPLGPITEMTGTLGARSRTRLADTAGTPRCLVRYGSAGREHMDLARGELQFGLYGPPLKPWDHAAGALIHREAGNHNALLSSRQRYCPRPGLVRDRLLFAPDPETWTELAAILG